MQCFFLAFCEPWKKIAAIGWFSFNIALRSRLNE
jgi:hypothetical protein